MRPLYETDKDFENEKRIKRQIEQEKEWKLTKLPKRYYLDFFAFTPRFGQLIAVLEVKRRHNTHDKYPDVILSLAKYMKGAEYADALNVDFLFVVQFNDGLYIHEGGSLTLQHLQITFGGRTDRNDPEDIEPVVHIPVKALFTKLGEKNE